jgi:hypothetical protein
MVAYTAVVQAEQWTGTPAAQRAIEDLVAAQRRGGSYDQVQVAGEDLWLTCSNPKPSGIPVPVNVRIGEWLVYGDAPQPVGHPAIYDDTTFVARYARVPGA